jgi:uncharacterized protein with ParB-like and HNH nuclease domain
LILKELLERLEAGFYAVPETQRYFVWTNSQIRDLASSIYNWYPIGGIIVWEMPNSFIEECGELMRPLALDLPEKNMKYMVIDGQQRLTSLLLIKRGSIRVAGPRGEKERRVELFFNPMEEIFELGKRNFAKDPKWFNVTEVLNAETVSEVLERKAKLCGDDSVIHNKVLFKRLEQLRERLNNYEVTFIETKLDYLGDPLELFEKISRIFVTINSKGTRIRMPDLVLALVGARVKRARWVSFRDEFNAILKKLEKRNFEVSEPVVMRLYLAIATGKTKFKDATKELDEKKEEDLLSSLKETERALLHSLDFLWREVWIPSSKYLQSHYLLVPLGYLLHRDVISRGRVISEDIKKSLIKWLILASVEKRYTGRLETDLSEDISIIGKEKGVKGLLDNLRLKSIPREALEGSYDEYHLTLLMALYHETHAKDWDLDQGPTVPFIGELRPTELQVHHIFPRDVLEAAGMDHLIDDFANITVISSRANEKIGDELPSRYLKELYEKDPELLRRHFIPIDHELWNINNYEKFLEERRKLILEAFQRLFP